MEQTKDDRTIIDFFEDVDEEDLDTVERIDTLIGKHRDCIRRSKESIEMEERRIKTLEKLKSEIKYGENSVIYEFADYLHEKECKCPPTCTWGTTNWDNFHERHTTTRRIGTRDIFYNRAIVIHELSQKLGVPFHKARELIKTLI